MKPMRTFYRKFEKLFTLRFSILTIFISFFVFSILIVASISYMRSAQNLSYLAEKFMVDIANTIYREVVELGLAPTEYEVNLTTNLIEKGLIDVNNKVFFPVYMLNIIKLLPLVQGTYWATAKNGDYWNCEDELDFSYIRIIDRTKKPPSHTITYLDKEFAFLRSEDSKDLSYDPRTRPWYIGAINTKGVFWSDIYLYTFRQLLGVVIAKAVYKDGKLLGVYTLKLSLDFIENYVKQQKVSKNGIAFMLTKEGKLIALSNPNVKTTQLMDVHKIPVPWIGKAYDIYETTKNENFIFTLDGADYLAAFRPIPEVNNWLIGSVAPESDFIGELRRTNIITLVISLFVLFIGLYLVSQFVTRIVRPLKLLVQETERIKNFDLEGNWHASSRIKEIHAISDSIHAMKQGLRSFKKYVPASLVRQLINTGQDAHIGGEKRKLAIFFSDIKDFTTIAEHLDPNKLVNQVCDYLELLSQIIIDHGGTIDKYIGDSIMAFWGAPAVDEDPTHKAARAVLQCQKILDELNQTWQARNQPIFTTRFGLHWPSVPATVRQK